MLRALSSKSLIFFIVILLIFPLASSADVNENPDKNRVEKEKTYSETDKKGWWWYEKEKVEPEEEDLVKKEIPKHPIPDIDNYTIEKLWDMHPDDFQALLMDFQKEAVRNPTEKNVRDYYVMQDIARRKALAFTHVAGYVMQKYPRLNVAAAAPMNAPGRNATIKLRHEDNVRVLRDNKDDFALLYFTAPGCKYCDAQDGILVYFVQRTGWSVKTIDVQDRPDLAEKFGIQITPSIILIYRNSGDFFPVSAGAMDAATMELSLARGVQQIKGEMTPEQYGIYEHQRGGVFDPKAILNKEY